MNTLTPCPERPTLRQHGFTLVELMVAMTIGLFLVAVLGYVLLGAKRSFSTLDSLSRMQEDARFAFESMAADIRLAGFTGGPFDGGTPVNAVNNPGTGHLGPEPEGSLRHSRWSDTTRAGPSQREWFRLRGDALTVVRADNEAELALASTAGNCSGTTLCTLASWPASGAPEVGDIFVAADYTHSAVFQASAVSSVARPSPTDGQSTRSGQRGSRPGGLSRRRRRQEAVPPAGRDLLHREQCSGRARFVPYGAWPYRYNGQRDGRRNGGGSGRHANPIWRGYRRRGPPRVGTSLNTEHQRPRSPTGARY